MPQAKNNTDWYHNSIRYHTRDINTPVFTRGRTLLKLSNIMGQRREMSRSSLPPAAKQARPKHGRPPDHGQQVHLRQNKQGRQRSTEGSLATKRARPPSRHHGPEHQTNQWSCYRLVLNTAGLSPFFVQDRGLEIIPRRPLRRKGHWWHTKSGRPPDRAAPSGRSVRRNRPPDTGRPRHADASTGRPCSADVPRKDLSRQRLHKGATYHRRRVPTQRSSKKTDNYE